MPTYEWLCNNCQTEFEIFCPMSDASIKICPNCSSDDTIKLISGGGAVIIKGTSTPCYQKGQRKKTKKLGDEKVIPPWRSSKNGKPRKDILKNPDKYIQTGEV